MDNIIICLIIVAIVAIQFYFVQNTLRKIELYKNIFIQRKYLQYNGEYQHSSKYLPDDDMPITCCSTTLSPAFQQIIDNLNAYLVKNGNQIADYHLMKDIVDRNCDTKEEEINTQIPFPLYLGLMGTMLGILVGVGFLVFGGGLNQLLNVQATTNSAGSGIIQLLSGVALAMISSVCGIMFTTYASFRQKNAKRQMELKKDDFLGWIQEELLPQLSTNMSSALVRMTQQLTNFNESFAQNTKEMRDTLSLVNDASKWQAQLLQAIDKLKIDRIASANIAVYDKLKNCTEDIDRLGIYLKNTENYLQQVQILSEKLGDANERSKTIERLGLFFESEIKAVNVRKAMLNESVSDVDNNLRKAIQELRESAQQEILSLGNAFGEQTETLKSAMAEQSQTVSRKMEELTSSYPKLVEEREKSIDRITSGMEVVIKELKKAQQHDKDERMDELISSVDRLYDRMGNLSQKQVSVETLPASEVKVNAQMSMPRHYKVTMLVCAVLIAIYCLIGLGTFVFNLLKETNWL